MTECRWCGETHIKGICPKVKAIEFRDDGVTVKRIEFLTPMVLMPMNGWPMMPNLPQYPFYPPSVAIPRWTATCGTAADPQVTLQNSAGRPTQ
jgi:hypothetical protein